MMKTSARNWILVILLIVTGCKHQLLVQRLDALDGLTEPQIAEKLGAPMRHDDYPMSKAVGEFRTSLQKYHHMPQSRDVQIREVTWEFRQHYVTAWLHQTNGQWIVFDSLRYQRGVQF